MEKYLREIRQRWREPGKLRIASTLAAYLLVGISCATMAYWLTRRPTRLSGIYFVREPARPADQAFLVSHFVSDERVRCSTRNVAFIRERTVEGNLRTAYWCPMHPGAWGEVEIEYRWEASFQPHLAILEPNLAVATIYDPTAVAEFAIASDATNQQWNTLLRLDDSSPDQAFIKAIDISRWVQGCTSLRIRYRLRAEKLMYHPTPNDPIGYAGAQCLRQYYGSSHASRLRLWKQSEPLSGAASSGVASPRTP